MLKKFFLGILAFSIMQLLSPATIVSQDNTIGKIIFAYTQIKKGGSADLLQQSHFFTTEKIYARAFLKDKFGTLGVEEFGMVDLWIDEVFIKRFVFSNYDLSPSGKEMRLYVHNTGKDDFDPLYFSTLERGDHKIRIVIGRDQIIPSDKMNDKRKLQNKKYIHLAEGNFILTVQ